MISRPFYLAFQLLAGAGDALTGILLVLAPGFALRAMGIRHPPADLIAVSFVGAFVFSVGLSYLLFLRRPASAERIAAVRALWLVTGVQRICIALFVAMAVLARSLELAWSLVSAYDASIAAFQLFVLRPRLQLHSR